MADKAVAAPEQTALSIVSDVPQIFDFDLGDFGVMPDWDKEAVVGKVIIVWGVSEAEFEGVFAIPARALLYNLPEDPAGTPEWGMLLSGDSPAIKQAQSMVQREKVPFYAKLEKKESSSHRGYEYWTLVKWVVRYNADGSLNTGN